MKAKRQFTPEFRKQVVEEIASGVKTRAQAIRQYELSSSIIYRWQNFYEQGKLNNQPTPCGKHLNQIADLERKVGQMTMELDLLKKARAYQIQKSVKSFKPMVVGPLQNGATS